MSRSRLTHLKLNRVWLREHMCVKVIEKEDKGSNLEKFRSPYGMLLQELPSRAHIWEQYKFLLMLNVQNQRVL